MRLGEIARLRSTGQNPIPAPPLPPAPFPLPSAQNLCSAPRHLTLAQKTLDPPELSGKPPLISPSHCGLRIHLLSPNGTRSSLLLSPHCRDDQLLPSLQDPTLTDPPVGATGRLPPVCYPCALQTLLSLPPSPSASQTAGSWRLFLTHLCSFLSGCAWCRGVW